MPVVPVPLANGDPDIALDLQKAFSEVYDAFGFDYTIKYQKSLEHPMNDQQTQWAAGLLQTRNFPS